MTEAPSRAVAAPADAAARAAALDPHRSFIVQAPAGSGKTELLIRRLLSLLAQVDAPEEIVALTFTRKAAGEMRARVLQALARAADDVAPDDAYEHETWTLARAARSRGAERGWSLAEQPGRLRVMTLDALCALLARRMPLLSRLGGDIEVLDDAVPLYRQAARATLALLEDGTPEQSDVVARVLLHLDNRSGAVESLLIDLLARRDQWIRHVAQGSAAQDRAVLEAALSAARHDAFVRLRQLAAPVAAELVRIAALAASQVDPAADSPLLACGALAALPAPDERGAAAWSGIASLMLTSQGRWRRKPNRQQGFLPQSEARDAAEKQARRQAQQEYAALVARCEQVDGLEDALAALGRLPPARYDEAQWLILGAVVDLLRLAAAQLRVVCAERGVADYTAVAHAAMQALGTVDAPTDLLLALDARIRHLLVDEFQDTSVTQFELLARLTAGWSDGDGRTLFLVGDPMQSIYRFREAEVGLFLRARRQGVGDLTLSPLVLSTNFRSARGLVDWVNGAFAQVFPREEDVGRGAVAFVPATQWHPPLPGAAVTVHAFDADVDLEPARVAAVVAGARAAGPHQAIAILVRSRSHLADIVPRLRAQGVPLRAVEIEALCERPVVQDLTALTRALVHPADRIAWLAVLRAPWCGMTLADLHALASGAPTTPIWSLMNDAETCRGLSDDGHVRLAHAVAALAPAVDGARRSALRDAVEAAWLRLAGAECLREARDLEDAEAFLGLLGAEERAGDLPDFARFEERMARLFAAPSPTAEGEVAVEVMTIHKAKGLEFDVVIVPRLARPPRRDDPPLLAWSERPRADGGADLLLGAMAARGAEVDSVHRFVHALEKERARLEATRLLYVAATRAKRQLHLIGSVAHDDEGGAKEPPPDALLHGLWPVVAAEFAAPASHSAAAAGDPAAVPTTVAVAAPLRRLAAAVLGSAPPATALDVVVPSVPRQAARAEPPPEFSWAGESARLVGSVVHRWLQRMSRDSERWDEARVRAAREAIARELAALGVPGDELPGAAARAVSALCGTLADARGRWVLAPRSSAASELRLTGVDHGELVDIAIDRTFIDEAGVRWIVDYKTGTHEGGDVDDFLDRERERYRAQLERYARLVRGLGHEPVRCGLYFPLLRAWREWTAGG